MSLNQGVTVSSTARPRGPVGQGRMAWTEPTRQRKAQRQDGNKAGQPRLPAAAAPQPPLSGSAQGCTLRPGSECSSRKKSELEETTSQPSHRVSYELKVRDRVQSDMGFKTV